MTQARATDITSKTLDNNDHRGARAEGLEKPTQAVGVTPRARTALEFADTEPDGTPAIARCYELVHSAESELPRRRGS